MRKMFVPMSEFKVSDEAPGRISGYASIFGSIDLGGDIILKDQPFKEFQRTSDGKIVMLFSHDSGGFWSSSAAGGVPIGKADVEQNSKGLKFDGQLIMDDEFVAKRLYPNMKAGTIEGMSIGYDILPGGGKINESGVRELSALKLWEISPVVWGMHPKAGIDAVKNGQITSVREFEEFLRDAGFSKAAAVAIAAGGWKSLQGDRRDSGEADIAKGISFLESLTKELST